MKPYRLLLITLLFSSVVLRNSFAGVAILNGLTHIHSGSFGSTLTGTIKMQNSGKKEVRMLIYQQDISLACDKAVDFASINSHERSLGKWLKTNVEEKIIKPNEEYEVTYSITIPADAKDKGTYWGIIMVEAADPIQEETPQGLKIDSKTRYAVQIIMDVGVPVTGVLSFEKVDLDKKMVDSTKKFAYTIAVKIKNSGIFYAKTKVNMEVFNNTGEKVKVIEGMPRRIYPNRCNDFEIEVKDLPKGKYEAVLVADNGKELFGSNISLEIE
jgi:hypothetical protein